ncbi:homocysteine S-methyltransferase family protein [Thermotomaculum hydrothermale]|uniref:homocysteine S-methyltransferase family protein n=1 Tax=Thermotomaculum hydrothermale TaxID=981385 RepID=UPI00191536EC|nr:homocysteine S-methyltransferase family protein [Thermotomaculum hydrothermale]
MKDFLTALKENFLIADGAFGTYLNQKGRPANICRSEENLKNPELVIQIHKEYIEAGAKIIETNTFDGNILKLSQFELEDRFELLNKLAVQNAKKAAKGYDVYVAGSIGPTNALLKPYGNLTEEDFKDIFSSQAKILIEEGVDLLILETFSSLLEIENAVKGIRKIDSSIPIVAEITILEDGLTKFGDRPDTCFETLLNAGANVVGINCTLGPAELFNHYLPYFNKFKDTLLSAMPNSGYPVTVGDRVVYPVSEDYFKEYGLLFLENGVKLVGGCCGTTPSHIKKLADTVKEADINRKNPQYLFLRLLLQPKKTLMKAFLMIPFLKYLKN